MKKFLEKIIMISMITVLMISLTACGDKKETQKDDKSDNDNSIVQEDTEIKMEGKEISIIDEKNDSKLSLENFKKVMEKHNLNVVNYSQTSSSNSQNELYMVQDSKNKTNYSLNVYKEEKDAKRAFNRWTYSKGNDEFNVLKNEENDHLKKYVVDANNGRHYYFRENEVILDVSVSEDANNYEDALKEAEDILKELGF